MNYIIFYDRSERLWTTYRTDAEGNQITEAQYASTKDQALILLGMTWNETTTEES